MRVDEIIGQNLRQLRLMRGLTQEGLAQAIGVSFQQVQKYERGSNQVSAGRLVALTQALDCSLASLFVGTLPGEQREVGALTHTRRTQSMMRQFMLLPEDVQASFSSMLNAVGRQLGNTQETGV